MEDIQFFIKRKIKYLWMLFFHPILFLRFTVKCNLYVGRRADIRHSKNMKIGKDVRFGYDTRINFYSKEEKLFIGNYTYVCNRCSFIVGEHIYIGENVLIASDVMIVSHNHGMDPEACESYGKQPLKCEAVTVEDGVWIGEKAIILPGVTIGEKSIIGAGAVVVKDIPPYCIAVGNPARIIKKYHFEKKVWEKYNV